MPPPGEARRPPRRLRRPPLPPPQRAPEPSASFQLARGSRLQRWARGVGVRGPVGARFTDCSPALSALARRAGCGRLRGALGGRHLSERLAWRRPRCCGCKSWEPSSPPARPARSSGKLGAREPQASRGLKLSARSLQLQRGSGKLRALQRHAPCAPAREQAWRASSGRAVFASHASRRAHREQDLQSSAGGRFIPSRAARVDLCGVFKGPR